jgi:hypothetical protein
LLIAHTGHRLPGQVIAINFFLVIGEECIESLDSDFGLKYVDDNPDTLTGGIAWKNDR